MYYNPETVQLQAYEDIPGEVCGPGLLMLHISPEELAGDTSKAVFGTLQEVERYAERRKLVLGSVSESLPCMEVWRGASLLRITKGGLTSGKDVRGAKRGKVIEFSRASRVRLMRELAKVRREMRPYFITLTYPDTYKGSPERWKRDLDVFLKRLKREYPEASGAWRLELMDRKSGLRVGEIMPHFHILLWGLSEKIEDEIRVWVSRSWFEAVGTGDISHLKAGTNVTLTYGERAVTAYVSKYVAKVVKDSEYLIKGVGRWWGWHNRERLPVVDCELIRLRYDQAVYLLRLLRRRSKQKARPTLHVFCNPDVWQDRLTHILAGMRIPDDILALWRDSCHEAQEELEKKWTKQ